MLPKISIPSQNIKIDNIARFRYLDEQWLRLIDASVCGVVTESNTKFAIFP